MSTNSDIIKLLENNFGPLTQDMTQDNLKRRATQVLRLINDIDPSIKRGHVLNAIAVKLGYSHWGSLIQHKK
jgi:hypothetical protein